MLELDNSIWARIFALLIIIWISYIIVYRQIFVDCCTKEDLKAKKKESQLEILKNKCEQGEINKEKYEELKHIVLK